MQQIIIFRADERHPSDGVAAADIRLVDSPDFIAVEIEVEENNHRIFVPLSDDGLKSFTALLDAFCNDDGAQPGAITLSADPELVVRIGSRGEPYTRGVEFRIPEHGMRRFIVGDEVRRMKKALADAIRAQEAAFLALEHAVFLTRDRQIKSAKRLMECLVENGVEAGTAYRALMLWARYTKANKGGGA